jgi:pimeloyl-ACP methyl ester carboxylesterase
VAALVLINTGPHMDAYIAPPRAIDPSQAPLGKPLLVIFGEEDRRWRSSSAADYRAVHGARVEMLPGLGHTPILEDPARTASSLLAEELHPSEITAAEISG